MLLLMFLFESIVVCVGRQGDNIAFSTGAQPEFSFQQTGTARS